MIVLSDLELRRGTKLLFSGANLSFYNKQKIGITGRNGSGKTSLFLLLQQELEPSKGELSCSDKLRMVTIEQEIPRSGKSSLEYVIDADCELRKYQQQLAVAEESNDGIKIAEFYEILQTLDAFTAETRAAKILDGLGFGEEEMATAVDALSGGWRMRLNIARALFTPSEVLLLDEPTNHLDLDAVIWLEKWLQQYSGLLLFISHDRDFLDKIADSIVHIEHTQLRLYSGNYSSFEKQRAVMLAQQQQQYEKQQQQRVHIEAYIRRFRYKASKARQAQSRIKALERMEEIMPAHADSPFSFEFKDPASLANPLLTLDRVNFGYEEELVLAGVNFQLNANDRVALLGRNGAGKSTLIKLLAGELMAESGNLIANKKVQIGYFAQHTVDRLNETKTPLQNLQEIAPDKAVSQLRAFLGGFNFSGDMALMEVEKLSGGEKARLALALIVWQAPNVLLLDEPTNHLDLDMRQALIFALQSYEGAVVVVSHDRFLLTQVVDEYWLVAEKMVKPFAGDLSDYKDHLLQKSVFAGPKKQLKPRNSQKQLAQLERRIEKLQQQLAMLEQRFVELSSDANENLVELQQLGTERGKLLKELEGLESEWLRVAE